MLGFISTLFARMTWFLLHVDQNAAFPPPISKEEEEACLRRLENGDEEARQELITHNLRLVAHMTKKFYSSEREQEDLISIGSLGLMKAAASFHPQKGTRFATFASRCIENEILMYYRAKKKTAGEVYFDDPLEYDKDGNALTLLDVMSDCSNLEEQVDKVIQEKQLNHFLKTRLEPREWEIIVRRYGLSGYAPETQQQIADKLEISRSYVSRLEKAALKKLRDAYDSI